MSQFVSGQPCATGAWVNALGAIFMFGQHASPRGKSTLEYLNFTTSIDMRRPVVTIPERKLSYRFMAAEAYWILSGDYRVSTIADYNPRISEFSDDGKTFFGAYGPMILSQLNHVVASLVKDRDTRQAGLTIWRPNPPPTKDVPCTVALFFNIRGGRLNCHSFMRSNDAWLGFPYDVFNFSMVSHLICARYNTAVEQKLQIEPGALYHTAASFHLYEDQWEDAQKIIATVGGLADPVYPRQDVTPDFMVLTESSLMDRLDYLRSSSSGDPARWWE